MNPTRDDFIRSITSRNPPLSVEQIGKAAHFAEILHDENKVQNLTRIIGPEEFYLGHLLDVIELFKQEGLGNRVLDLGSGGGVPGLLAAALDENTSREWLLVDSELSKADFLSRSVSILGLERVKVCSDRVENVIKLLNPDTVIARAVGTVDKISAWIWNCSTWNNLILFKSRGWVQEWAAAKDSRFGKKLTVTHSHEYSSDEKYRVLVTLKRK